MYAAVMREPGGPAVLTYEEMPTPAVGPGQVLFEVHTVAIQGGDLLRRRSGEVPSLPFVVGYQASGRVSAIGSGTTADLRVNDRVVALSSSGSHASEWCIAAEDVFRVPDDLDLKQAACVPAEFGTAHEALIHRGGVTAGEWILMLGASGGVGRAATQLARNAGARIIAASTDVRRIADLGADATVDLSTDGWDEQVRSLTGGHGVDAVFDPVGGHVQEKALRTLRPQGRLIWLGRAAGAGVATQLHELMLRNADMLGIHLGNARLLEPDRTRRTVEELLARVASGELSTGVDRSFSLSEAAAAHAYLESGDAAGRVVLTP